MEIKAKIKNIYQNLIDDCTEVVIQTDDPKKLKELLGKELRVKLTKWSEKRSLDANAYLWVLVTELAKVLKTSKEEMYEVLLQRYPVFDDPAIVMTVKADVDMDKIGGHWFFYKEKGAFKSYIRIKGSSEYDTKEMAHFLDMVIEDAKAEGIETLTPQQLLELKSKWKQEDKKNE